MAIGHRMGLLHWGDGTDRLSHWDSEHGNDVHFVLTDDGVMEVNWAEDAEGNFVEYLIPVPDFGKRLRELLRVLEAQNER